MSTTLVESHAVVRSPATSTKPDRRDVWIAGSLALTTFAYLLPFYRFILLNADEGVVLQGAQRVIAGQIPYRDFFSFLPPLSFYWTALLLKLFGDSILVPRAALLVYGGIFSALTYLLARRTVNRSAALLAAYVCGIIALPTSFYVQHNWESTLFATLAVVCAIRLLDSASRLISFALGALVSLTILSNQAKGAGLTLGIVIGFALVHFLRRDQRFIGSTWKNMIAGFLFPLAVTSTYFLSHGALRQAISDVLWPLRHYTSANSIPYGYITMSPEQFDTLRSASAPMKLFFALTLSPMILVSAIPIFGIMIWLFHVAKPYHSPQSPIYILLGSALFGLWLSFLAGRRDPGHIIYMLPLFAIIIAWIVDARDLPIYFLHAARPLVFVGMLLVFSLFGISELFSPLNAHDFLNTRRGLLKTTGMDSVFPYVQAHLKPGDKLFVYPYQPLYYFLTATSNPTSYDYLQPGMNSDDQLDETIQQLERDHTQTLLFTSFNEIIHIPWPNTPLSVVGREDPLALYIVRHYRTCANLRSTTNGDWVWLYMVRMGADCPPNLPEHAP